MSFSSAINAIKDNLAIAVFGLVTYAGAGVWLWNEFRDLQQQTVQLEQRKSEVAEAQNKRELELKSREYIAGQVEAKNAEREGALKTREQEYQRSSEQLKRDQQALIEEYGVKAAERQLQNLMSEFSALGVDLNANPYCGSQADLNKFNSAVAKYSEIAALAQAHSLEKKYRRFLTSNEQHSFSFGCYKVEHIKSPAT
jgi:DNA repair exonuclease SbcCD ATPase subunit